MSFTPATPLASGKLKKAVANLAELVAQHPEKERKTLIREIESKFDLTPRECEFLETRFSGDPATNDGEGSTHGSCD